MYRFWKGPKCKWGNSSTFRNRHLICRERCCVFRKFTLQSIYRFRSYFRSSFLIWGNHGLAPLLPLFVSRFLELWCGLVGDLQSARLVNNVNVNWNFGTLAMEWVKVVVPMFFSLAPHWPRTVRWDKCRIYISLSTCGLGMCSFNKNKDSSGNNEKRHIQSQRCSSVFGKLLVGYTLSSSGPQHTSE